MRANCWPVRDTDRGWRSQPFLAGKNSLMILGSCVHRYTLYKQLEPFFSYSESFPQHLDTLGSRTYNCYVGGTAFSRKKVHQFVS